MLNTVGNSGQGEIMTQPPHASRLRAALLGLIVVAGCVVAPAASASVPVYQSPTISTVVEPARFVITITNPVTVGSPATVRIEAVDASGHKLTSYDSSSATWSDATGAVEPGTPLAPSSTASAAAIR